ncbi:MAG: hypothetical protein L3J09_11530, partial [Flavobacteriaceae bacterium]|nr:hypothetical protein [Flavobacteriaceae bacterium]
MYNNTIKRLLNLSLFLISSILFSQTQAPSIQTGVTFQWEDTQSNNSDSATIESITIDGQLFSSFAVPSTYAMTRVGPNGHTPNKIKENGSTIFSNSNNTGWDAAAISAFQDKNLNHYFVAFQNGDNICNDFGAIPNSDTQIQSLFYADGIPSNSGGVVAVTERGGNNCFYIEIWGIPTGGGVEQLLGETYVRNNGNYTGCSFGSPISGSDYWKSGRCNENGQTVGIALFSLEDVAPVGSLIKRVDLYAATSDHGDGKFFILQSYAVPKTEQGCKDEPIQGTVGGTSNIPIGSSFSVVSGPTPAGQSFTFDNATGDYFYEPSPGFTGDVVFEYEVCLPAPNQNVCDTSMVTITFEDLPQDPVTSLSYQGNGLYTIEVTSPLGSQYEYSINNGTWQSSPLFTDLNGGTYLISVRNVNTECENETPTEVIIDSLEINVTTQNATCSSEGSAEVSITGGVPPYTILWSYNALSTQVVNLPPGEYAVIITDSLGFSITETVSIGLDGAPCDCEVTLDCPADFTEFIIDDFNDDNFILIRDGIQNGGYDANGGNLCNSRELWIENDNYPYIVGGAGTFNNIFVFNENAGSDGTYYITYDGMDNSLDVNNPSLNPGLSGLDLTDRYFTLDYVNGDLIGTNRTIVVTAKVWDANGTTSQSVVTLDNSIPTSSTITFSQFSGTIDLTNIRAIQLKFDSNGSAIDAAFDNFKILQGTITNPLTGIIIQQTNLSCGVGTGFVVVEGEGGTPPYSYSLGGNTNQTGVFDNLSAGSYTIIVSDVNGCEVEVPVFIEDACLSVIKSQTNQAGNVGDMITYDIVITNTGNTMVTNIEVTDANATITGGNPIASLAPGASATVTAERTITQADIDLGYVENTAVATGDSPTGTDDVTDDSDAGTDTNGNPIPDPEGTETPDGDGTTNNDPTDDPTVTVFPTEASMSVIKSQTSATGGLGDTITYDIVVSNTGNVTLTDIEVTDANATITGGNPIASLAPGASATVTAERTITQADIDLGYVENTAVATG